MVTSSSRRVSSEEKNRLQAQRQLQPQHHRPIAFQRSRHNMPPTRRSSSSPSRTSPTRGPRRHKSSDSPSSSAAVRNQRVDRFGFITNIDSRSGKLVAVENNGHDETAAQYDRDTPARRVPDERQKKLWKSMASSWKPTVSKRRQKQVLKKLRQGLPDAMRGTVWVLLGGVKSKIREQEGGYDKLIRQCERDNLRMDDPTMPPEGPNNNNNNNSKDFKRSSSFQNIQETIERDLDRTYPRHSLFYNKDNHKDDLPPSSNNSEESDEDTGDDDSVDRTLEKSLAALCNEDLTTLMSELDVGDSSHFSKQKKGAKGNGNNSSAKTDRDDENENMNSKCETIVEAKGGQAALRRVLCAYSYYDREVGYCQGMNFIAGMFITIMSEEEAFWLLVTVMNEQPCRMRGLFAEGMSETHKVLYVAEKLIHHFVPKLAKHLDKENVHVTMYATQWLLTQYTSNFNFDLVTRVWDCFLVEGFKVIYRVMLALLHHMQPTLLKMSFEEILGFFRALPDKVDGDVIMEETMKIPLKRKHIDKYEKEWQAQQNK